MDVAIVDLNLPDGSGTDLIKELRASRPRTKALVLSAMSEQRYLAGAIEAGAAGIMHKSAPMSDLVEAVRRLAAGEQLLSQQEVIEALRFIVRERESHREAQLAIDKLTPREREVLQALAEGLSDREIATATSRGRGNGTLPRSEHPLQARGFFEAAGARLRRAPRPSNDRVTVLVGH